MEHINDVHAEFLAEVRDIRKRLREGKLTRDKAEAEIKTARLLVWGDIAMRQQIYKEGSWNDEPTAPKLRAVG